MAQKKERLSFESWVDRVGEMVYDRFGSSLEDLEEEISADVLKEAFDDGLSPATFFREEVRPLFDEDEDDDDF